MKTLFFSLLMLATPYFICAQTPQTIKLDNNKVSSKAIKPELQYLFADFQNGKVIMRDSKIINSKLNYNFLTDEILFIDAKGTIMALANPHEVTDVYIGNRWFITTNKGYFEVIEKGTVSLLYKWICNFTDAGKEGALGIAKDAPGMYQMNQISFDARTWRLDVDKEAVVTVKVIPYLRIKSKNVLIKGGKDFLKAFPGKRNEIKMYIDKNPVDFRIETDLRRLTKYCNSL